MDFKQPLSVKLISFLKISFAGILSITLFYSYVWSPKVYSLNIIERQTLLVSIFALFFVMLFTLRKKLKDENLLLLLCLGEILFFAAYSHTAAYPINILISLLSLNIFIAGFLISFHKSFFVLSLSFLIFTGVLFWEERQFYALGKIFYLANTANFLIYYLIALYFKDFFKRSEVRNFSLSRRLFRQESINDALIFSLDYGVFLIGDSNAVSVKNDSAEKILASGFKESILLDAPEGLSEQSVEKRFFKIYKSALKDVNEYRNVILVYDETEENNLKKELEQEKKLSAIGKLSAGLAHEIRNPLAGISGSIELLKEGYADKEISQKLFKTILREIERLNLLITDFLGFARPEVQKKDEVDFKVFLNDLTDFLKSDSRGQGISLQVHCESKKIKVDENKLRQVFMNFIINAFQAFDDKRIEKLKSNGEQPTVFIEGENLDLGYRIKVRDNGVGIKKSELDSIFEPFHTTKDKGTGLGLAVSHRILEGHSAMVSVESEPGKGTEFSVLFKD